MATLSPNIDPSAIENGGERTLASALKEQLPDRVHVFHSIEWLRSTSDSAPLGECDFVVFDPEQGFVAIEVKGGTLEYDPKRRVWERVSPRGHVTVLNKDPFTQVRTNMFAIRDRISEALGDRTGRVPFAYGYAVALPHGRFNGDLPCNMTEDTLLDIDGCRELDLRISRILDFFSRGRRRRPLSERQVEAVCQALLPRYQLLPVAWRQVEDQERRLVRLTAEQQELLDSLRDHRKAAIQGVAGSGKTVLAVAKAQESVRRGQRTLLLCYNRSLKEWLADAMPEDVLTSLDVRTYHGLVRDFCKVADVPFEPAKPDGDEVFWRETTPELLIEAADRVADALKYDAVIVDEGQDFHELWWTSLEAVFRNPDDKACYYVFYDPHQNLFTEDSTLPPELGVQFYLGRNCRNTRRIASHCAQLIEQTSHQREGAPLGDEPELVDAPDVASAFERVSDTVRRWCMPGEGGLKPSQVAVLARRRTEDAWPTSFGTIGVAHDFAAWRRNEGVLLTSWKKFKGLEADAVAIVELPDPDTPEEIACRYVARSRAKHLLTVVRVAASGAGGTVRRE